MMEYAEWATELPEELRQATQNSRWEAIQAPYSGAFTYRIVASNGTTSYLKICPIPNREPLLLARERLVWLQERITVPNVLHYSRQPRFEFLHSSEIEGDDASSREKFEGDFEALIRVFANGLRLFHKLPVQECPFDHTLSTRLEIAASNRKHGALDLEGLNRHFPGQSPEDLFSELWAGQTDMETELVVNHGDYSMPNIVVNRGRLSGFIDLGNCGVADKYFDLAVAEKSIVRNYGAEWVPLFFEAYGISNVDEKKIRYYQLLECFL